MKKSMYLAYNTLRQLCHLLDLKGSLVSSMKCLKQLCGQTQMTWAFCLSWVAWGSLSFCYVFLGCYILIWLRSSLLKKTLWTGFFFDLTVFHELHFCIKCHWGVLNFEWRVLRQPYFWVEGLEAVLLLSQVSLGDY